MIAKALITGFHRIVQRVRPAPVGSMLRVTAQLRDPQFQIHGRRREGAVAVALVGAFRGTLMAAGADRVSELGLDQSLANRLRRSADTITNIGSFEYIQDFEQGRLVQGNRVG